MGGALQRTGESECAAVSAASAAGGEHGRSDESEQCFEVAHDEYKGEDFNQMKR